MQEHIAIAVGAVQQLTLEQIDARLDEIEQERFLLLAVRSFRAAIEGEHTNGDALRKPVLESRGVVFNHPWRGQSLDHKLYRVLDTVGDGICSLQIVVETLDVSYQTILNFVNGRLHYFVKDGYHWKLSEVGLAKLDEMKLPQDTNNDSES